MALAEDSKNKLLFTHLAIQKTELAELQNLTFVTNVFFVSWDYSPCKMVTSCSSGQEYQY